MLLNKYLVVSKGRRIGIFYAETKWDAINQAYNYLGYKTDRAEIDAINLKYLKPVKNHGSKN